MRINRVNRIKGYKIFQDFVWPTDLLPFAQFNLIYGWNGSGKTILAELFRHLESHSVINTGTVEFELDNAKVRGIDIEDTRIADVRVFDRESINKMVLQIGGRIDHIHYAFGEEDVKKQKELGLLKDKLKRVAEELGEARTKKTSTEESFDEFCKSQAVSIKHVLSDEKAPKYINYNKREYKKTIEEFDDAAAATAFLAKYDEGQLRKQTRDEFKPEISKIDIAIPDFEDIRREVADLLERSVTSRVIEELNENKDLSKWVQEGLSLHSDQENAGTCKFCGGVLQPSRLEELRAHFNDAFTNFQADIRALISEIGQQRDLLINAGRELPEPYQFYNRLTGNLESGKSDVRQLIDDSTAFLDSLQQALKEKLDSVFATYTLDSLLDSAKSPERDGLECAINSINAIIEHHNNITAGFQLEFEKACNNLEKWLAAKTYPEYSRLKNTADSADATFTQLTEKTRILSAEVAAIEKDIKGHLRPADELNNDLRSYLGRDELKFDVEDTGYALKRYGQHADGLCEGEKTAIAFLYFLKSLKDISFDIRDGVVVIDDPISSLDANSLFSAFGCMKEMTKEAGQLFILTHNFAFFRQVRGWFLNINRNQKRDAKKSGQTILADQLRAHFYLLEARNRNGQRSGVLKPLHPLLEKYESEYHYLFKLVYEEVGNATGEVELERYYIMPNVARRLLETFLAFSNPDLQPERLTNLLDRIEYEPEKKSRILRFLHTYSHSKGIEEPEHDLSVLSETKAVLRDLLDLIKTVDKNHYEAMERLIGKYAEA
jgi:wobble nucleotide-excising tRNase